MPSSLNPHRHVRTGRSGCVPGLRIIPDVSINTHFQKELKKLAKAQGSALPLLAGTPLASTPAAAPTPTQSQSQPPRTSTPVPVPRGVKREFDDSSVAQPNTQGPGAAAVNGTGVTPISVLAQRPGAAKAGVPGARPRPVKKQRIVSHGCTLIPRERNVPISLLAHMIVPAAIACDCYALSLFGPWIADTSFLRPIRTCKAKRGICIHFNQCSSLLRRASNVVFVALFPFLLKRCSPIHYGTYCWSVSRLLRNIEYAVVTLILT